MAGAETYWSQGFALLGAMLECLGQIEIAQSERASSLL